MNTLVVQITFHLKGSPNLQAYRFPIYTLKLSTKARLLYDRAVQARTHKMKPSALYQERFINNR
jgi:hypothetical protein